MNWIKFKKALTNSKGKKSLNYFITHVKAIDDTPLTGNSVLLKSIGVNCFYPVIYMYMYIYMYINLHVYW